MSDTIEDRIEEVDEIRSGHELYKDDLSLTVTFDNLSEPQAIALMEMFGSWESYGNFGASRWSSLYVDGDGPFHPSIDCEPSEPVVDADELREAAEIDDNRYDFDAVIGKFIDYALEVKDNE